MPTKTKKKKARDNGKHGGGRPSEFNDAKNLEIFSKMAGGGPDTSLRRLLKDSSYVSIATFMRWLVDPDPFFKEFREQYELARRAWATEQVHELTEISDDVPMATRTTKLPAGVEVTEKYVDSAHVSSKRLQVDTRKWMIARILANYGFGDKSTVEHDVTEKLSDLLRQVSGEEKPKK